MAATAGADMKAYIRAAERVASPHAAGAPATATSTTEAPAVPQLLLLLLLLLQQFLGQLSLLLFPRLL